MWKREISHRIKFIAGLSPKTAASAMETDRFALLRYAGPSMPDIATSGTASGDAIPMTARTDAGMNV